MSGNPSLIRTELVQGPPGPASTVAGPTGPQGPAGDGLTSFTVGRGFAPTRLASITTADATPTNFDASSSNTAKINQPENSSATYVGTVVARVRATGKSWKAFFQKEFTRLSAAPTADGLVVILPFASNDAGLSALDNAIDMVASGTAGDVVPRWTGLASTQIDVAVAVTQTGVSSPTAPTITGPAPSITSFAPTFTPSTGGDVDVTGTDFVNGIEFTVDGGTTWIAATWHSGTSITCALPAHAVGSVTFTVRNPDQQTDSASYTYQDGFVWNWPSGVTHAYDWVDDSTVTAASGLGTGITDLVGSANLTAASGHEFGYSASYLVNGHNFAAQVANATEIAGTIAAMNNYTIVARVKIVDPSGENPVVAFATYAPEDGFNNAHIHHYHGAFDNVGSDTLTAGELVTLAWRRTGDTLEKYVDDVLVATTTGVNTSATGTAMHVLHDGAVGHGKAWIAALAIADSSLSGSAMTSLHTQMVARTAP